MREGVGVECERECVSGSVGGREGVEMCEKG